MERDPERPTCILCDTDPHRCIEILQKRAPKYHYVRFGSFEEKKELAAEGGIEVSPPEKKR